MDDKATPHQHWVGKLVDVTWQTKEHGLTEFKAPPWKNKRVTRVFQVAGDVLAALEGHPCCPVRIERLSPAKP